jgi:ribosome-binding protein aMBF1 (putative translation factor)
MNDMRRSPESAVVAEFLGETFKTDAERAQFERRVVLLSAAAELIAAMENAREEAELSKAELARRLGVKPSVVSRLLNGKSGTPDLATLASVFDELGLYLDVRVKRQPKRGQRHAPVEVAVTA